MKIARNRRVKIFIIIFMATVLSVASFTYTYLKCFKVTAKDVMTDKVFSAVPSDVSSIFYFSGIESLNRNVWENNSLFSSLFFGEGALKFFVEHLYSLSGELSLVNFKKLECVISSHYSAKNKVSSLFAIYLNDTDISFIINKLSDYSKQRNYNTITIYRWRDIEFSIYKDFLLASSSPIILESSLRHLQSGASVLENEEFRDILSTTYSSDLIAFVNHSQVGKLFSGFSHKNYLKYSNFVSQLTSWSAFHFYNTINTIEAQGDFLNNKGWGNFLTLFSGAEGSYIKAVSVVPSNTFSLISISLKDISSYVASFIRHKEYYKKGDREIEKKALEWFVSLNAEEVSSASIPYGGKLENVTIIRSNFKKASFFKRMFAKNRQNNVLEDFTHKGYMGHLFGDYFRNTNEEKILYTPKWIFIGPQKLIEEFAKESFASFSMEDFLSQTKARNLLGNQNTLLSVIVNATAEPDSLTVFFKKEIKDYFNTITLNNNLIITAFQLQNTEDGAIVSSTFAYADSLKKMPEPWAVSIDKTAGWESDTVVKVPTGPFRLINFNSGDKEYLEQLPSLWIRLSDKNMKGLWAIPFSAPICGNVEQVDFNRNGKLQMLFAAENKIYLLDRLGRFVYPYPKSVDLHILLGPKTYDINSDGDYAIMLLHADNSLRLYDRVAIPYAAWNDITLEETIKSFPELIEIGSNKYWVLRTTVRTMIYTINGNCVTNFSDKNWLKPDSPVMPAGDSFVKVRSVQERELLLNLETGKIRKLN